MHIFIPITAEAEWADQTGLDQSQFIKDYCSQPALLETKLMTKKKWGSISRNKEGIGDRQAKIVVYATSVSQNGSIYEKPHKHMAIKENNIIVYLPSLVKPEYCGKLKWVRAIKADELLSNSLPWIF